ncbi:MAG: alpha-hydroxy-acid oxidizing protein [Neptuniibacter sp.]
MDRSEKILAPLNHIPIEAVCAQDYEWLAPNFIPQDKLAYICGGSGQDVTLQRNVKVFSDYSITPRVLRDVSNGTTRTTILGRQLKHPIFLAPVAYQSLAHSQAEIATAYAAESTDSCMVASTLSSVPLEQIAECAGPERWFQLYFQHSEEDSQALINRAIKAGYKAIVVTIDAAVQVPSMRAIRAGFQLSGDIVAANIAHQQPKVESKANRGQNHIFDSYMQNAPSKEQLQELIKQSPVPVIIKGVLHPDDAKELKAMGAAGIIVSNHGGRTLDGAPASLTALPTIRSAVGDEFPVFLDSGIRSGADIFKAIASGADAVLIGRLQVYALSVAGALGVAHMLKLLREELELTMAMAGCSNIDEIKKTVLHKSWEQ